MSASKKLKEIIDLENSPGWQHLNKIMEDEILQAAMLIAESPKMELDEINFRRGARWAAARCREWPVKVRAQLESEVALGGSTDPFTED